MKTVFTVRVFTEQPAVEGGNEELSRQIDEGVLAYSERRALRQRRFTVHKNGTMTRESGRNGGCEKSWANEKYPGLKKTILQKMHLEEQLKTRKNRISKAKQSSKEPSIWSTKSTTAAARVATNRNSASLQITNSMASWQVREIDCASREPDAVSLVTKPTLKSSRVPLVAYGRGGGGIRVVRYS